MLGSVRHRPTPLAFPNSFSTHFGEYRWNLQGPTYTDVSHDDLQEALIRRPDGVYVTMPFQTHQPNVVGGCWERTETRTRPPTGRSGCCSQTTTPCSARALRGYWPPTG